VANEVGKNYEARKPVHTRNLKDGEAYKRFNRLGDSFPV